MFQRNSLWSKSKVSNNAFVGLLIFFIGALCKLGSIHIVVLMHRCRISDPCQYHTFDQPLNFCEGWPDLFWDWAIIRCWGDRTLSRCQIHHSRGVPWSICLRCEKCQKQVSLRCEILRCNFYLKCLFPWSSVVEWLFSDAESVAWIIQLCCQMKVFLFAAYMLICPKTYNVFIEIMSSTHSFFLPKWHWIISFKN